MRVWKLCLFGAALAAMPLLALAGAGPGPVGPQAPQNDRGACRADVERLCGDLQPGRGARRQCLRQHRSELSPACSEHIAQVRQRMAQVRQACGGEAQRLCSNVQPGRGAIVRCMRDHESELSNQCREALPEQRARR